MGLTGADAPKNGRLSEEIDSLANDSQLGYCLGSLAVGEERGGVTGALFEIRRGGREEGMELRTKAKGYDPVFASARDGLGNEEDDGLGWYEGIGLGNDEDGGLGLREELGVMLAEVTPMSIGDGLDP